MTGNYIERFRRRVLQDAVAEALPAYWLHRAELFRWAKSKPADRPGVDETTQQQELRDSMLEALAVECVRRARAREELDQEWWVSVIKQVVNDAQD